MPPPPWQAWARLVGNGPQLLVEHPQPAPEELGPLIPHVGFHGPRIAPGCPDADIIPTRPLPTISPSALAHTVQTDPRHAATPLKMRPKVELVAEEYTEESGEELGEEFGRRGIVSRHPSGGPRRGLP